MFGLFFDWIVELAQSDRKSNFSVQRHYIFKYTEDENIENHQLSDDNVFTYHQMS